MLPVLPPDATGWHRETPFPEILGALRAIVPLVLLLVLVQLLLGAEDPPAQRLCLWRRDGPGRHGALQSRPHHRLGGAW